MGTSPADAYASTVCLTLDLDWAPDHVLEDTRALLAEAGLPATIFATHHTPGVVALTNLAGVEMGVHPNFLGAPDENATFSRLLSDFPGAVGVRNHLLFYHSRLLPLFAHKGMRYFSNDLMFLQPDLAPFYDWSGLIRLPIYWEDDVHCLYFDNRFGIDTLRLEQPGMKILNFHPVHLFLNTREEAEYQAAKPVLHDPVAARALRKPGPGIRTLFLDVVQRLRGTPLPVLSLVAERFRASTPFAGHTGRRFAQGPT
jgi:hypothetical protein